MTANAQEAFASYPNIGVRSADPNWISLSVRAELAMLEPIVEFFRHALGRLCDATRDNLTLVLHELLENAIEHGCGFDPSKQIELTCVTTERMVLIEIRDPGPGFRIEDINHTALKNPPGEPLQHVQYRFAHGMRPGGYGIVLVQQIVDELVYNQRGNEVIVIKYL
ncbi:MAG TPA: ATP-binding protein [Bryobacteraceae bacterium]|nr:ATP-binding protein [Bryobacteraceae bacterium]